MRKISIDGTVLVETKGAGSEDDVFYFERSGNNTGNNLVRIENNLTHVPAGIKSYASHVGVCAHGSLDFSIVKLDKPGAGKAVYTTSLTAGDAVIFDRKNTDRGDIQLICVISKNAAVFTSTGARDIQAIATELASTFNVAIDNIIISCTGVIGQPLPMSNIIPAIQTSGNKLVAGIVPDVADAILTTDRQRKTGSVKFDEVVICGYAKGAGMIEPNMATMLAYFYTNADITKEQLDTILKRAVSKSFNSISVDSDASTSDTVALVSTRELALTEGQLDDFERALTALCIKLARDIVGQAEGSSKVIEVDVAMSTSDAEATLTMKKILNSPLVKTAVYGADPNWGRIVMAVGKPNNYFEQTEIEPKDLVIQLMGTTVFNRGMELDTDLELLSAAIRQAKSVSISVEIGAEGRPLPYRAKGWGCDLTERYVKINSEYTT